MAEKLEYVKILEDNSILKDGVRILNILKSQNKPHLLRRGKTQGLFDIEQREVWDKIAPYWSKYRSESWRDVEEFIEELLKDKSKKNKSERVLETGCGNARNLILFAKEKWKCFGIDFSSAMVKEAGKNALKNKVKIDFKLGNIAQLPYKDNQFEIVLCVAVLHCLNKKEQARALSESFRVLKNGGKLLLSVWNRKHKAKEKYVSWNAGNNKVKRYYYFFESMELRDMLEEAGFKIVRENIGRNMVFLCEKRS